MICTGNSLSYTLSNRVQLEYLRKHPERVDAVTMPLPISPDLHLQAEDIIPVNGEQVSVGTFYAALDMKVNLRGIEIAGVTYQNQLENGEPVLAISGKLVNVSGHELPVPPLRVSLSNDSNRELYHWTFDAGVTTLAGVGFAILLIFFVLLATF